MPTYLYECPNCGQFDKFQKVSADALTQCPVCSAPVKRLIVGGSVLIKGAGALKGGDWGGKMSVENYYKRKEKEQAQQG